VHAYPEDIEPSLLYELIRFREILKTTMFGPPADDETLERSWYRTLMQVNLRSVLQNVEIILCVVVSMMVTNAIGLRTILFKIETDKELLPFNDASGQTGCTCVAQLRT